MPSAISIDNENEVKIEKEPMKSVMLKKYYANKIMLMFQDNRFFSKHGTPVDENLTADRLLNELTQIKKGGGGYFHS